MTASDQQVTVECYVRAGAAGTHVDALINTVQTCEQEGRFDECTVDFWPDELRLTDDTEKTDLYADYRQFRAWAEREGVSLEPAFTRRERTTLVSDHAETVLLLPVLCLAIYTEEEIVSVAPHTAGTTPYTATDALADIQSLPRVESKDVAEFPPGHPIRTTLTSHAAEGRSARGDDETNLIE